jgi:hypothetical protein
MYPYFEIAELSAERSSREWQWLCSTEVRDCTGNAFGDLFLQAADGAVARLDVTAGRIDSNRCFMCRIPAVGTNLRCREWFLEDVKMSLRQEGFHANSGQCCGYKIPLVFAESSGSAENVCIADVCEYVSFLGDLHRQLQNASDGTKVRLNIGPSAQPDQGSVCMEFTRPGLT